MTSSKAWYWVAAGVLALGLNGEYRHGGLEWAHRIVDRSDAVMDQATARGRRYLALAELLFGANPAPAAPTEMVLARVQEQVDCAQARLDTEQAQIDKVGPAMARAEAAMQRAQVKIEMARVRSELRASRFSYMCPRTHRMVMTIPEMPNVTVPQINVPRINAPKITVPRIVVRIPQAPVVSVPEIAEFDADDML